MASYFDRAALSTTQPRRVLVVDDNRVVADTVATLVRLMGHYCACAYDGPSAVSLAPDFKPDVILMDLRMPEMDGFAAARALKEAGVNAKIVAITGFSEAIFPDPPREAGFDAVLTKPATAEQIAAVL
jgi:CheY-like chemotaxis protein